MLFYGLIFVSCWNFLIASDKVKKPLEVL